MSGRERAVRRAEYASQTPKVRRVLALAERQGFRLLNGKKHLKVFAPSGELITVLAHGSARLREVDNLKGLLKHLKRAGFREEGK